MLTQAHKWDSSEGQNRALIAQSQMDPKWAPMDTKQIKMDTKHAQMGPKQNAPQMGPKNGAPNKPRALACLLYPIFPNPRFRLDLIFLPSRQAQGRTRIRMYRDRDSGQEQTRTRMCEERTKWVQMGPKCMNGPQIGPMGLNLGTYI